MKTEYVHCEHQERFDLTVHVSASSTVKLTVLLWMQELKKGSLGVALAHRAMVVHIQLSLPEP